MKLHKKKLATQHLLNGQSHPFWNSLSFIFSFPGVLIAFVGLFRLSGRLTMRVAFHDIIFRLVGIPDDDLAPFCFILYILGFMVIKI